MLSPHKESWTQTPLSMISQMALPLWHYHTQGQVWQVGKWSQLIASNTPHFATKEHEPVSICEAPPWAWKGSLLPIIPGAALSPVPRYTSPKHTFAIGNWLPYSSHVCLTADLSLSIFRATFAWFFQPHSCAHSQGHISISLTTMDCLNPLSFLQLVLQSTLDDWEL